MTLPTEKIKASLVNPRELILFGLPKSGKTSILSYLEDCLIVDIDDGAKFFDSLLIEGRTLEELLNVKKELAASDKQPPYKYIALDTITTLNDVITPLANEKYKQSGQGKNWTGDDVRTLPNGAGYYWVRMAFNQVLNSFKPYCETIILVAHLRDKLLEKDGKEFSSMEVELEGKLRSMIPAHADAIGYVYRKKNQTIISFITSEQVICGSRSKHLKNTEIVIAESDDTGEIVKTYWDKIFI